MSNILTAPKRVTGELVDFYWPRWWIFKGDLHEIHDSIQGTKKSSVTKPEHLGPWFEAQHYDSYFRQRGRYFGEAVDQFILNVIKRTPGVVPSSKLSCILKLGKEFGPENLDAVCVRQLEKGDYRLRSLRRELES